MKINRLILASSSRFRQQLLAAAGIQVAISHPDCDEAAIVASQALALAKARAEGKALSLSQVKDSALVIGADQVLEFEGRAYGKADSEAEARQRLMEFQGKSHSLHSAFCLALYQPGESPILWSSEVVTVPMTMRKLSLAEVNAYLDTQEWQGCAGCYQYENKGALLFAGQQGDASSIIGLPIFSLLAQLRDLGINPLLEPLGPWNTRIKLPLPPNG